MHKWVSSPAVGVRGRYACRTHDCARCCDSFCCPRRGESGHSAQAAQVVPHSFPEHNAEPTAAQPNTINMCRLAEAQKLAAAFRGAPRYFGKSVANELSSSRPPGLSSFVNLGCALHTVTHARCVRRLRRRHARLRLPARAPTLRKKIATNCCKLAWGIWSNFHAPVVDAFDIPWLVSPELPLLARRRSCCVAAGRSVLRCVARHVVLPDTRKA